MIKKIILPPIRQWHNNRCNPYQDEFGLVKCEFSRLQFLIISTIMLLISEFVILFDTYLRNMQPVAILSSTIQFLVQKLLQEI